MNAAARLRLAMILVAASTCGAAQWDGLRVDAESLPRTLRLNGVSLQITRLTGADVPLAVARIAGQWRQAGGAPSGWSAPQTSSEGPWTIVHRHRNGVSEVLQHRDTAEGVEALLSSLDASRPPQRLPMAALPLPPGCAVSSTTHTVEAAVNHLELVAVCNGNATRAAEQMRVTALAEAWRSSAASDPASQHWVRGNLQVNISSRDTRDGAGHRRAIIVLQQLERTSSP